MFILERQYTDAKRPAVERFVAEEYIIDLLGAFDSHRCVLYVQQHLKWYCFGSATTCDQHPSAYQQLRKLRHVVHGNPALEHIACNA